MNLQMQTSWRNLIVWAFVGDCFCTSQSLFLYVNCGKSSSWKNYWIFHPQRRQKVVFVWKIVWRIRDREEVNRMWRKKFWFCSNWIFSCRRRTNKLECPKQVSICRCQQILSAEYSWSYLHEVRKSNLRKDIHFLSISSLWLLLSSSSLFKIELFISFLRCCCFDIECQPTVEIFGENSRSPSVMRNKQLNSSANYSRVENKQHEKVKFRNFASLKHHTQEQVHKSVCEFRSWAKRRTRKSNKNLQKFSTAVERYFSLFCDSICVRCFSLIFHLFGSRWNEGRYFKIAKFLFCLNFDFFSSRVKIEVSSDPPRGV